MGFFNLPTVIDQIKAGKLKPLAVTSLAKVGVVVWQPMQSPLVGWFFSSAAMGRESPAVLVVPASMPM